MTSLNMSRVENVQPSSMDIHHIHSPKVQKIFDVFLNLFCSCAGPSGKIHAVCNNCGGHVTFTSTSSRLLASMLITCPELKLITTSVQSHLVQYHDCGLFMTCVCLQIIKLSIRTGIHFHIHKSLYEAFLQIISVYLKSSDCKISIRADFTDLQVLLAYVRSIVSSKHLLNLTNLDSIKLSELIIKAFVNCIPSPTQLSNAKRLYSDGVYILGMEKSEIKESKLEHGLLLEYPELSVLKGPVDIKLKISEINGDSGGLSPNSPIKVALFTCSMSGDMEEVIDATFEVTKQQSEDVEESVLDKMIDLCDNLEKCKVGLVLCQKVIHPKLKATLRSKGILFIERLGGLQKIPYLQDLTDACPMASVLTVDNLISQLGCLDSVDHVVMNDKSYLHLANNSSTIVTLILCAQWEERLSELKNCVKASLQGLYSLAKEPRLLAGGGCWQIHCSYVLRDKVLIQLPALAERVGCTESRVLTSLAVFRSSLHHWVRSLAGSSEDVLTDLSSYHCWRVLKGRGTNLADSEVSTCCCGHKSVSTSSLQNFADISEDEPTSAFLLPTAAIKKAHIMENAGFSNIILDNFSAAVQALDRGVFTASMVLSIGVSITDQN